MEYHCEDCGMGVKALTCALCEEELIPSKATTEAGDEVQVSECPNGCGMIKSPTCCGHDMECRA